MRLLWIVPVAVAGVLAGYLVTRFEGSEPVIGTAAQTVYVGGEHRHVFELDDEGTGVERVDFRLESDGEAYPLKTQSFEGNLFTGARRKGPRSVEVVIDVEDLGLPEGPASLIAEARDFSWRDNVAQARVEIVVDTRAPRVAVLTGLTYVSKGGSEAAVYRITEDAERDGIEVGERFFAGFPHPEREGYRVALFALPHTGVPDAGPSVLARDRAGNETRVPLTTRTVDKQLFTDVIRLDEPFMARKVAEIAPDSKGSTLDAYLEINGAMRTRNATRLRELCRESSPQRLWEGAFLQLPNSATRRAIGFGVRRSYTYEGQIVDRQTHLGLDLASTARAPVPAANHGRVVLAEELGIYGNAVVLDHGVGLFSLYAHLSEIEVVEGDEVSKGDVLGRTGATGLAGGDHLHFSMLVQGYFVDPLEWLDGRWIADHIDPKLHNPVKASISPPEPRLG